MAHKQDILCLASEPAYVPGYWNRPFYNPGHTEVHGYVPMMGAAPPHFVNPCAGGKLDTLQELDALNDSIQATPITQTSVAPTVVDPVAPF